MCNETLCFLVSSALGSLIPGHMRGVSSSCNFSCNSIDLVSQSESRIQILLQFDWMAWFSLLQPDGCCKNFEKRWKPSFLSCSLGPRLCSGLHVHLQVTCGGKHVCHCLVFIAAHISSPLYSGWCSVLCPWAILQARANLSAGGAEEVWIRPRPALLEGLRHHYGGCVWGTTTLCTYICNLLKVCLLTWRISGCP